MTDPMGEWLHTNNIDYKTCPGYGHISIDDTRKKITVEHFLTDEHGNKRRIIQYMATHLIEHDMLTPPPPYLLDTYHRACQQAHIDNLLKALRHSSATIIAVEPGAKLTFVMSHDLYMEDLEQVKEQLDAWFPDIQIGLIGGIEKIIVDGVER